MFNILAETAASIVEHLYDTIWLRLKADIAGESVATNVSSETVRDDSSKNLMAYL